MQIINFFGNKGLKYFGKYVTSLKELVEKSNLPIIYEKYIGNLFFYSFLSLIIFFIYFSFLFYYFWKLNLLLTFISAFLFSITMSFLVATIFYFYPFYKYNKQLLDIDRNLPLGITYMSIISDSGVPPEKMFRYVAEKKEFGEFSKECERIYKYIAIVGKDITSAMKEVASRTPSEKFKNFLSGLMATILSGGEINLYLREEAKKGIGIYKEKQKKFTHLIGLFSDIFIVLFLIAPLVIVIILTSFSLIEPSFLGYNISFLIKLITYIGVPLGGLIFLIALDRIKI